MTEENKNLTIIDSWDIPSKEERETILNYSHDLDNWHIYTDVPKHARKYEKFLDETKPHRKGYSANGGVLAMLEGYLNDSALVSIRQRARLTDKQKELASKRLAELRKKQNA
ncbi:hypothetical protein [Ligilactobacillus murinus]|uniref:hypothetical protein n=1 Tax=Ligilactobacillus murinus TaxID=1622 RepID=UPI000E672437|nr:hypothetical protein [Ligilactobacillus murinus]MBX9011624.1 hypothetical protein [Ligilactobacillus murinus]NBH41811.1 hypothetical protein [Ligilactobacillus murinus]RII77584.1 hypothetical protein D1870_09530 [Ligilactobacillus murinus]